MSEGKKIDDGPTAGWRFKLGVVTLAIGLFGPLIILPTIFLMDVSTVTSTSISGAIVVVSDLLVVASAAIMGKDGYAFVKARFAGYWRLYGPPQTVGKVRYTVGLTMLGASVLLGWSTPYASFWFEGYVGNEIGFAIAGDVVLLTSLFVLGGDVIRGFVFAMIWGVIVGTYSSIFVASAALLYLGVKRDWSKPDANAGNQYANIDA